MRLPKILVLGSWGNTMLGAVRNKEICKRSRTPTQDPSTMKSEWSPFVNNCVGVSHPLSTRILGETTRDAVRNKERWERAPYAYPRS